MCSEQYPLDVEAATGSNINGTLLICGGKLIDSITGKCYVLQTGQGSWKFHVSMNESRSDSESVVLDKMLWVTGGHNNQTEVGITTLGM